MVATGAVHGASAGEFPDFSMLGDLPSPSIHAGSLDIRFDIPNRVPCRDVTTDDWLVVHPNERLVQVAIPVSLVLYHGEEAAIDEVVVEIDGAASGLRVVDYSPRTELTTSYAAPIERKRSEARDTNLHASLGGVLGPEIALTPGAGASLTQATTECETELLLPPRDATVVSGTVSDRRGVYFKLRSSSQTTLEGERDFRVTFAVPRDWQSGEVELRCVARGEQKWLFVEKQRVWSEERRPVALRLVTHTAAKPIVDHDHADRSAEGRPTGAGSKRVEGHRATAVGPIGVPLGSR
jgi:hypothetical protein